MVLTGYLDDGTAGLATIKRHGGTAVVQDPDDAEVPSMPRSAIANVNVDAVVSLARMPDVLVSYVRQSLSAREPSTPFALQQEPSMEPNQPVPSVYTCPECHGTLWEVQEGHLLRFECRVGHAYSQDSMVEDQGEATERALWAALRSLEESGQLLRRLLRRSEQMGQTLAIERFEQRAQETEQHAATLRRILGHVEPVVPAHTASGTRTSGV